MITLRGALNPLRIVDCERRVWQMCCLRFGDRRRRPPGRQAAPDRRELLQHRTIAIALHRPAKRHAAKTVSAWKMPVKIVEAAVLGVKLLRRS